MQNAPVDNRVELMDRALELFAAYGYDGVGVQQICQAAAVTKPTLYHYFCNKRGLLETLLKHRFEELLSPLRELSKTEVDLAGTLERAASIVFAFARKNPSFYRLYLALWFAPTQSEGREVASRFHALHFEALEAVCGAAMRAEPGLRPRVRALTASFLGMLNNTIGLALNNHGALNDRVAYAVVDQFLHGILQRPAAVGRSEQRR
jgi:TetR/AcrR family transcriptional regulator